MDNQRFVLEVRGDWACFTRPEMKVERVSYDVITPSAARAVFEAIYYPRCAGGCGASRCWRLSTG
jgi:CRISPR-associated protein Cas5d